MKDRRWNGRGSYIWLAPTFGRRRKYPWTQLFICSATKTNKETYVKENLLYQSWQNVINVCSRIPGMIHESPHGVCNCAASSLLFLNLLFFSLSYYILMVVFAVIKRRTFRSLNLPIAIFIPRKTQNTLKEDLILKSTIISSWHKILSLSKHFTWLYSYFLFEKLVFHILAPQVL